MDTLLNAGVVLVMVTSLNASLASLKPSSFDEGMLKLTLIDHEITESIRKAVGLMQPALSMTLNI